MFHPNEPIYNQSQASYWTAQQSELTPRCRFYPQHARDVQQALSNILIPNNVSFAVVSGGHSSNTGASNIHDSITIDLSHLNDITLSDGNATVFIGPGARWNDVYSQLESQSLTVSGGRVSHVGVGGYVLGGGFSWFSNQFGWTTDSVLEFEVVTPGAEILSVNVSNHPDLFWALKGSLGAFGIVTRIKMPTIPNRWVYAGAIGYTWRYVPRILNALLKLIDSAPADPATQGYLSFAWVEATKQWQYSVYLVNTEAIRWNDVFAAFKVIRHRVHTLRTTTIGEAASEIDDSNPVGLRRSKFTLTCKPTFDAMMGLHELVRDYKGTLGFDDEGILGVTFQPLTVPHLSHHRSNIFNLDSDDGPLLLVSVDFWWSEAERDAYFHDRASELRQLMTAKMQQLDVYQGWIYPNYASSEQNPFETPGSISPDAKDELVRIRGKYDPQDLWRRLVPGIWHI